MTPGRALETTDLIFGIPEIARLVSDSMCLRSRLGHGWGANRFQQTTVCYYTNFDNLDGDWQVFQDACTSTPAMLHFDVGHSSDIIGCSAHLRIAHCICCNIVQYVISARVALTHPTFLCELDPDIAFGYCPYDPHC